VTSWRPDGDWPVIIQGGMGVGVSGWPLARAVSVTGQLGVVSGVALDTLLARRLQLETPEATSGGRSPASRARMSPTRSWAATSSKVASTRAAVPPRTALVAGPDPGGGRSHRRGQFRGDIPGQGGHDGLVGVNYLEKIQMATPAAAYGAMLAGVD